MNFANVEKLVIPEGEVVKITHGSTVLWERPGLPSIYQEVEYLQGEANVATYIDLGFAFDTKARFLMDFEVFNISTTAYPFGAAENGGVYRCCISAPYGSGSLYFYGTLSDLSNFTQTTVKISTGVKLSYEFVIEQGNRSITELTTGTITKLTSQGVYTMTNNLYLFAQNYNGTARVGGIRKIYKFQYYDKNDELICDLIPCYRKSDGVCGMYDRARKIFLTNVGGGADFTKGADV